LYRRLDGPQGWAGWVREISLPQGSKTFIFNIFVKQLIKHKNKGLKIVLEYYAVRSGKKKSYALKMEAAITSEIIFFIY